MNHFHDSKQLTRKDLLKKNLNRYTAVGGKFGNYFRILPETYILPQEYTQFVKSFTEMEAKLFTSGDVSSGDMNTIHENKSYNSNPNDHSSNGGKDGDRLHGVSTSSANLWIMKPVGKL